MLLNGEIWFQSTQLLQSLKNLEKNHLKILKSQLYWQSRMGKILPYERLMLKHFGAQHE